MKNNVAHCWLLDLDRTISSVEIVMEAVEHVCKMLDLDYSKIDTQLKLAELHGNSFSVPIVVMSLWPEKYDEFCEQLQKVDHLDSVFPDAKEFIRQLTDEGHQLVIITYGDPRWQLLKLHFGQLEDIPHIICDIPDKSVLLQQYKVGEVFELHTSAGVITAKKVTLVDDKPAAFVPPCEGVSGILIERRGRNVQVPAGVQQVVSFNELKNLL